MLVRGGHASMEEIKYLQNGEVLFLQSPADAV